PRRFAHDGRDTMPFIGALAEGPRGAPVASNTGASDAILRAASLARLTVPVVTGLGADAGGTSAADLEADRIALAAALGQPPGAPLPAAAAISNSAAGAAPAVWLAAQPPSVERLSWKTAAPRVLGADLRATASTAGALYEKLDRLRTLM